MRALWIALVLGACSGSQPPSRQPSNMPPGGIPISDLVQRVRPAIVDVAAANKKKTGIGFVVDRVGIIATTLHTVEGELRIEVRLSDDRVYPVTEIVGFDAARDLALLRIQPARELPVLVLGNSKPLSAGDPVAAIRTSDPGVSLFSTLISQITPLCDQKAIAASRCQQELTTLAVSLPQGSAAAGPVFDQRGEVVGLIAALVPRMSVAIAIPCDYLKLLIAHPSAMSLEEFARSTRPARQRDVDRDVPIVHHVPDYDVAVFDGCTSDDVAVVVQRLDEAVRAGAPLFDSGNREGSFRIYEGTVLKLRNDLRCAGARSAFETSLEQATSLKTYKEKASALRDTFDGMLDVARRWRDRSQQAKPSAQP